MSLADDLYRETILDHYHNPRNHGVIEHPTAQVEGVNPLCGDELTLYLTVKDGKIEDVKLTAKGCSINTASGSMMSELLLGKSVEEANQIVDLFKRMMLDKKEEVELPDELEDLEALRGVKKYPVRIKCALLPWNTMLEGLDNTLNSSSK
ncbi:MAG: SUF system NifU family Fe-S cluster assembly protein [Cyanobacteria bacterium DS2.3.42]|nr:SUF system NifU family Fe-S cluster assembly protein [Cyanobacteria bacterium DS2.3.42]